MFSFSLAGGRFIFSGASLFNSLLAAGFNFNSLLSFFSARCGISIRARRGNGGVFFNSNLLSIRRSQPGKRLSWRCVSELLHALVSIHAAQGQS
jgi:hypothetical protein